MKFKNEDINKILIDLHFDEEIHANQIPNIDLYMDQVIQLFENNLSSSKRYDTDKILTKTMINNYAKDKLLFPIKNKKYSKEHILLMILTYDMKQILSIGDIKKIFAPMIESISSENDNFNIIDLYEKYIIMKTKQIEEENKQVTKIIGEISELYNSENKDVSTDDYKELILLVLTLLNSANNNKRLAEKIIDSYF